MTTRIHAPPGSDARRAFVGASEVPALLGVSPYASAYSVWSRIVHGDQTETTLPMQIGHALEPLILSAAAEYLGADVLPGGDAYLHACGVLGANLDGMTAAGEIIECKAWGERDADLVASLGAPLDAIAPGKALSVWWQVQTQMLCSGASVAHVAALCGKRLIVQRVEADAHAHALILAETTGFWRAHVDTGIAPAAAAADVDALRRVRLSDSDVTVEAPDLAQTLDERERLRAERDALDARLGDIDAAIRQRLGDARRLVCADWRVTRSLVSTQRVDTKALRSLYPEAAAACTATTTSDRMTVARSAR